MKLIHCADLHLDSRMTANLDKEKAKDRRRELLLTFERMVQYAADHQVDAILIAGDLFDTKNISAAARHAVSDAINGHKDITFYYLRGNHDTDHFLADMEEIPDNLKLFDSGLVSRPGCSKEDLNRWTSYAAGKNGKVVITGIELNRENALSAYHSLMLNPGNFNIVMLHGQESETGAKDRAEVISLRQLKNRGIDYLALGHIHSYKEAALDGRGTYCYPGCLEGRGFDECGEHGFVLLTVDEDAGTYRREFVPFAGRKLYTVTVDVSDCRSTAETAQRIEMVLQKNGFSGRDMLNVILTGAVDVESDKDISYLVKRFEPEYYFIKICDETTLKVDISRFMLDESLKGEFVRTVMGAEELSKEDKAAVIRYGLRAIDGEEILE